MKPDGIIVSMGKKIIIIFFLLTTICFSSIAGVQKIKAVNVEAHIGQGTGEKASVSDIFVEWGKTKFRASNKTMSVIWNDNQLIIGDGNQEISVPFKKKTINNEFNQYHFVNMNIDFDIEKHFKLDFDTFSLQFKNNYFSLHDFHVSCERISETAVLDTLEFCLTDMSSGKLSSVRINSFSAKLLKNLLMIEPQMRANKSQIDSDIKNVSWTVEKNDFHLKANYEKKDIELKGTIHYHSKNTQIKILIIKASYSIFSIKKRVYKKLRTVKSRYMSVDQNDVVTIKLYPF